MRPFGALTALATAGHHGFELHAGVGLVFEPFLGRRGALALRRSARHHFRWAREQALREPERWSPELSA